MTRIGNCSLCGARIEWTVTERGRRMPVDLEPRPDGNIVLSHQRVGAPAVAIYQSAKDIAKLLVEARAGGRQLRLYVSHFATCSAASKHRKPRKAAAHA